MKSSKSVSSLSLTVEKMVILPLRGVFKSDVRYLFRPIIPSGRFSHILLASNYMLQYWHKVSGYIHIIILDYLIDMHSYTSNPP